MKTVTWIAFSLMFLLSVCMCAQAQNIELVEQQPTGNLKVNGITYIPSQPRLETRLFVRLREGEVVRLQEKCVNDKNGSWKITRICTWTNEVRDMGSEVTIHPGGQSKETRWSTLSGHLLLIVYILLIVLVTTATFEVLGPQTSRFRLFRRLSPYGDDEYAVVEVEGKYSVPLNTGRIPRTRYLVKVHIDGQDDRPGIEYSAWKTINAGDQVRVWFRRNKRSDEIGPSWVREWRPKGTEQWIQA